MNKFAYDQQIISDKIFEFIYGCAMHDAILQRSFLGKKAWIGKLQEPKHILRTYIDMIIAKEFVSQAHHDKVFLETANALCHTINSQKISEATDTFSFGNAQKLINMAVKHIYSFCYCDPSFRQGFQFCHCPLDSIMLDKIWKLCKARQLDILGISGDFYAPWGAEGLEKGHQPELKTFPARYQNFQTAIRQLIGQENLIPIEFDYLVWK